MNRQKLTLVALMVIGLAAMVNAAQFRMNLYYAETAPAGGWNLKESNLRFGLDQANDLAPHPPVAVVPNIAWLEGPGDITISTTGNDDVFSRLSGYIKEDADAALWQLYVRDSMKISFVLASGSVPSGAILKIYPEGAEEEAIDWTDGMVLDAKADTTYLIDYRKTASTPMALAAPPVKRVQMRRGTTSLVIDFDVPEMIDVADIKEWIKRIIFSQKQVNSNTSISYLYLLLLSILIGRNILVSLRVCPRC